MTKAVSKQVIGEEFSIEDQQRWEHVRRRLRAELGDAVFDSWFLRLELERV